MIEILVSLVMASVVIGGAYQVFINLARSYESEDRIAEAQNCVRAGMEIVVADLRMAGYDKQGGGSNVTVSCAVSGSSDSIRVEWERDNDTIKSVQYFLSNRQLQRNVYLNGVLTDSPQVVLDGVSALDFTYTMSDTKFVKVDVTLAVENRDLSSSIIFRNVK